MCWPTGACHLSCGSIRPFRNIPGNCPDTLRASGVSGFAIPRCGSCHTDSVPGRPAALHRGAVPGPRPIGPAARVRGLPSSGCATRVPGCPAVGRAEYAILPVTPRRSGRPATIRVAARANRTCGRPVPHSFWSAGSGAKHPAASRITAKRKHFFMV